jgi:glutathione-regulated potassium-efflux system ancillary protein KefC
VPDPIIIMAALACGMGSRALGLPALVGYLAAGFVLHEAGVAGGPLLDTLAHMGITLLLFSIGLKLQPRGLLEPQVWGTTLLHMLATQILCFAVIVLAGYWWPSLALDSKTALILAFALTFSSTVFVIQVMQERGEMASRHAAIAIGVLIIQDIVAVLFLAISAGKVPELSALWLLLLIPARGPIIRLLSIAGHGELFTLAGFALAILGAQAFDAVGIKGDLGALLLGALLAGDRKAKELARNLLYFKDLFLVGFFLSIGLAGWPEPQLIAFAVVIGLLALLKPLLYFPLYTVFHTSSRTALLAAISLANHSEFGLIVIAVAAGVGWIDPGWSSAMSIAVAVSFLAAAPLNRSSHNLYDRWRSRLLAFETRRLRDTIPDTRDVRVLILGMGRVGTGAYDTLAARYDGHVMGIDENESKLEEHRAHNRRVASADASDPDFWHRVALDRIDLVMLALTNHQENLLVTRLLHRLGYKGKIAAVVRFDEEAAELEANGISAFNLYARAGAGFASMASRRLLEGDAETAAEAE